jgi:hypothetical protein
MLNKALAIRGCLYDPALPAGRDVRRDYFDVGYWNKLRCTIQNVYNKKEIVSIIEKYSIP